MHFSTLVFLIIGVPLILLAFGFLLLCLKWLWSKDQRANQVKLLDTAARLDATLSRLEVRLTALEDILLPPRTHNQPNQGVQQNSNGRAFDHELAKS
jgi:hypothetical protein